jgi:hypothetical protein
MMSKVRVELPQHLRTLAGVGGREVTLDVDGVVSIGSVLDALEARYPMLTGTIRDHGTLERRAFLRFFACEEDWSHEPMDAALPEVVANGKEPLLVIGAIAGGNFAFGDTRLRRRPEFGVSGHSRWSWDGLA